MVEQVPSKHLMRVRSPSSALVDKVAAPAEYGVRKRQSTYWKVIPDGEGLRFESGRCASTGVRYLYLPLTP
jgi:hypothetical protein